MPKIKTLEDIENLRTYRREYARRRRKDPVYREKVNQRRREQRQDPAYAEKIKTQNRASYKLTEHRVNYQRDRNVKQRQFLNLLKLDRPCYDCGGVFAPEVMDWDHLPGKEKLFSLGSHGPQRSLESCVDEINKCQLVCSNCHRIRTVKRRQEEKDKICQG